MTIGIAGDAKYTAQLRDAAIDTTTSLIAAFPTLLTLPTADAAVDVRSFIIQECFALCAAADDDEFDPNAFSSANLGTQTLDLLAQKTPDEVAAAVLARVQRDGESADENVRKSCLLALAVVPEPCKTFVSEHIAELFAIILAAPQERIRRRPQRRLHRELRVRRTRSTSRGRVSRRTAVSHLGGTR